MFHITVRNGKSQKRLEYSEKILISDALRDAGINHIQPCGGKGICRKCTVLANGKNVLACTTYVQSDTCIDYSIQENNIQGLTEGFEKKFDKKPLIENGYGMAVDIGTTTVACYLYKFPECVLVSKKGVLNEQAQYGSDVITRIEFCNNGGLDLLSCKIREQIRELSSGYDISKYVITGNTTMLHLLTGIDPSPIAKVPFIPNTLFGKWYGNAYLPSCISAYVGADITTAVMASDMMDRQCSFLVDIGTNGEMVLWNNNKLYCCSTAAGPAFEGANISQGVVATKGAINHVYIDCGAIKYTTIDNAPPIGICGSGIIDAVSCMLELGILDESGYLKESFEIADSGVFITASDIRNIQLAKSAIRSGIDTLIHESGTDINDIEEFYIAGGFGSYIDKNNASNIGIIPKEVVDRVTSIGNASGIGASIILRNAEMLNKSTEIAKTTEIIELSGSSFFMNKYIENMMF